MPQREPFVDPKYPTPRDDVALAVYDLRMAIHTLQTLRMANASADHVLQECPTITNCAEWLNNLSQDIRTAVFNSHVVDLRDKIGAWHKEAAE